MSPIVPVSGLALAPWRLNQVAGRSQGQFPRASLDNCGHDNRNGSFLSRVRVTASITIFEGDVGGTNVLHTANITEDGDLLISGSDTGRAPREVYNASEYEYHLTIPKEEKERLGRLLLADERPEPAVAISDELLLQLLEKKYANNPSADVELERWCKENGIRAERFVWFTPD